MYYIAGKDLSYSFVSRTAPSKFSEGNIIYRNLAYDKSLKMYVVSDFLPYGDGKVLCLIYPFDTSTAYKGRSIDRDARTRSGILVDHVLLGNGRMLALIYPIDGKEHYRTGPDGKLEYKFGGYSELWDPDVDKLMSYKYVRKKCDEVTFKIVEGIMGWL